MSCTVGFLQHSPNISLKPDATQRQKEAKRVTSPRMMKRIKKWCFAFLLLCAWTAVFSQPEPGQYAVDYDTSYVKDYRHRLNLSFLTEARQNTINALTANNKIINYQTNLPLPTYGVMFSYRWLNAQLSIPLPGISYTSPNKVHTDSYAFGLGFVARKWYFKNFLEYFKGYYMSNPEVVFPEYQNIPDGIIPYENMKSLTYLFTAYHAIGGKKYSHRALLWQSEVQKKSAGSFLAGITGGYKTINSDKPIFTSEEMDADVNELEYFVVGFNMGYTYTFRMWQHFNLSFMLVPGANYFVTNYSSNESPTKMTANNFGFNAEYRTQFSYENGNFFGGLSYVGYALTNIITHETPIGSTHNYLRLNFGYRLKLKPIKFLKPIGLSN